MIWPATLVKVTLLLRCFSRFLNYTNDTKLSNASHIFSCENCSFLFSESDNKWKGASLIEYQRRIFQKEVNDLKRQIGSFCEIWITKLDSMQVKHDEQLDSVQNWLKKVGAHFSLLSQKSVTHQTFTSSNSTNETLQKGVENVHS